MTSAPGTPSLILRHILLRQLLSHGAARCGTPALGWHLPRQTPSSVPPIPVEKQNVIPEVVETGPLRLQKRGSLDRGAPSLVGAGASRGSCLAAAALVWGVGRGAVRSSSGGGGQARAAVTRGPPGPSAAFLGPARQVSTDLPGTQKRHVPGAPASSVPRSPQGVLPLAPVGQMRESRDNFTPLCVGPGQP